MKQLIRKYALKAALVAGLLTLSAGGMYLSARANGLFDTLCPEMVKTAAEILSEMLGEEN
jgi:hypothetical protein